MPKVKEETYRDKTNTFRFRRVKAVDQSTKHEMIGYKHFLGHLTYIPDSRSGLALSKSSFALNRLQDVLIFLILEPYRN